MRCARQSGQGAILITNSKNQAPASVARLTMNIAPAAAAAGSAIRSVQVDFIQFDFIQVDFIQVDFIFTSPSSFSRQALCQSCGQTKSRVMDATAAQRYRRLAPSTKAGSFAEP